LIIPGLGLVGNYVLVALTAAALSALVARLIVARASRPARESERRYREIVAHSFGLICTHDLDGVLLMINAAAAAALGYKPEELVGRNLRELLVPEQQHGFDAYLEKVRRGEPVQGLMRLRTQTGEERVWTYRNQAAEEGGRILYIVGHAMDVTEQQREEKILKRHAAELARINAALQTEMEERARAEQERERFFDMSLEMLCIIGYDGYFKELNSAWEKTLGWTLEELKARPFVELVHPDDQGGTNSESQRLRMGGNVLDFENRYLTKDGTYRWISWRSSSVPESGLIYGVARDIQEQKQIEQMKNDFVSVVSHELRTPLTSIRGSLGLIAGGVAGELPEKARALVEIAAKNSERLVRLINDILDVEKIESGKMGFRFAPQELMPLMEQAIESNHAYAEGFQVELRIVKAVPGARVWADADRMLQVMTNLLSNAVKFSPRDGVVEVTVERLDGRLRVGVIDHGNGISPEFQARIFEKFAQADVSSTRQKGGTGLGLSISKAIVERHGGHIGFVSTPGIGATFSFDLPEWGAGPEWGEGAALEAGPEPDDRPRILVCEDDRDVSRLLCLMLEREGYRADVAFDSVEVKRLVRERVYAAMTLDLVLPGQGGVSLIRELRQNEATSRLPIVVVSVQAEEGRAELNGGALGVVDWLIKPIDQDQLISAVRRAVQRRQGERLYILHVEDDSDLQRVVAAILDRDATVEHALNLAEARDWLARERFDLVILDLALPDGSGLELLPLLGNLAPPTPVLIFSAHEVEPSIAGQVASVLVKSRTSNPELLDHIRGVLAGGA
jgi:PAS domain S-box-containing protein